MKWLKNSNEMELPIFLVFGSALANLWLKVPRLEIWGDFECSFMFFIILEIWGDFAVCVIS